MYGFIWGIGDLKGWVGGSYKEVGLFKFFRGSDFWFSLG